MPIATVRQEEQAKRNCESLEKLKARLELSRDAWVPVLNVLVLDDRMPREAADVLRTQCKLM